MEINPHFITRGKKVTLLFADGTKRYYSGGYASQIAQQVAERYDFGELNITKPVHFLLSNAVGEITDFIPAHAIKSISFN